MKSELLDRSRSTLVLIDFQERLFPNVYEYQRVLKRINLLLSAAKLLQVPMVLTEQYPRGLGSTIEEIRKELPEVQPLEKMSFSCVAMPGFTDRIFSLMRDQIVLTGIETHICVAQTALDLAARGENVFVVADATSSRRPLDSQMALRRLERNGLTITTAEAVVFEWLRRAGTEEFKALQPMLKALE
ncbi:MAG: hydrolase [Acidobacteria bacterium]|nr:hydrolase [Acidobacteriota bacterium]